LVGALLVNRLLTPIGERGNVHARTAAAVGSGMVAILLSAAASLAHVV
jgi:hypothetical protein